MVLRYLYKVFNSTPLPFQLFFKNLLIKCRIRPYLAIAFIAPTYNCNGGCHKCSISRYRKNEKEMGTEEIKILIDQLSNIRTESIFFFGGEPLLRKDIYELIDYSTKKGIKTEVFTNGYLLSKNVVKKLKNAGLSKIQISIDSPYTKEHDKLRGLPGCFKRATNGIKYCVNNDIPVTINTVAMKKNLHNGEIEKIILLGKDLKAARVQIIAPTMSGHWLNAKKELLEPQDYNKINQLKRSNFIYTEVEEAKKGAHNKRHCLSKLLKLIYISPYGEVQPCWSAPISFGNIRKKPLKDILSLIRRHNFNTNSHDCLANDPGFRAQYLKRIKSGTRLPIKIY